MTGLVKATPIKPENSTHTQLKGNFGQFFIFFYGYLAKPVDLSLEKTWKKNSNLEKFRLASFLLSIEILLFSLELSGQPDYT